MTSHRHGRLNRRRAERLLTGTSPESDRLHELIAAARAESTPAELASESVALAQFHAAHEASNDDTPLDHPVRRVGLRGLAAAGVAFGAVAVLGVAAAAGVLPADIQRPAHEIFRLPPPRPPHRTHPPSSPKSSHSPSPSSGASTAATSTQAPRPSEATPSPRSTPTSASHSGSDARPKPTSIGPSTRGSSPPVRTFRPSAPRTTVTVRTQAGRRRARVSVHATASAAANVSPSGR